MEIQPITYRGRTVAACTPTACSSATTSRYTLRRPRSGASWKRCASTLRRSTKTTISVQGTRNSRSGRHRPSFAYLVPMARTASRPVDRVAERRRAAALARHYRDSERLSIAEIARRLGRAPATIKAYLYDPTGEKARAIKARYRGTCRSCGATPATQRQARRPRLLPPLPTRRSRAAVDSRARA